MRSCVLQVLCVLTQEATLRNGRYHMYQILPRRRAPHSASAENVTYAAYTTP